ncbi:hypothetical protein GLS40_07910 [Pseudooceanicola sp. 216_PA32_1]|uniref:Uncharacterized protein n=1 Tax=Pseudooceanicola pacificus TaxID=2676438 RepID=A0A844WAE8_9RHOB|nr:hypothetical protein [Pseudooceanicola pacificus]MWB77943.1 hypothetical protein [Pseudooceanicola pacificus]
MDDKQFNGTRNLIFIWAFVSLFVTFSAGNQTTIKPLIIDNALTVPKVVAAILLLIITLYLCFRAKWQHSARVAEVEKWQEIGKKIAPILDDWNENFKTLLKELWRAKNGKDQVSQRMAELHAALKEVAYIHDHYEKWANEPLSERRMQALDGGVALVNDQIDRVADALSQINMDDATLIIEHAEQVKKKLVKLRDGIDTGPKSVRRDFFLETSSTVIVGSTAILANLGTLVVHHKDVEQMLSDLLRQFG